MNVIFLDFDGVLDTRHDLLDANCMIVPEDILYERVQKRIALLAEICREYNCKVVIEASAKIAIDEETMEISPTSEWVNFIFKMFKKYGVECIGRTPDVIIPFSKNSYLPMWKEHEIRLYLYRHPEIEHYCVIDDDDLKNYLHRTSDLERVRDHLVTTLWYSDNEEEEGLLEKHRIEIEKALQKENEIRNMVLERNNRPLPNNGVLNNREVFESADMLAQRRDDLENAKQQLLEEQQRLINSCSHEIVFKYNDNHPRKMPIDGHYYCPACGKVITTKKPEQIKETMFRESIIVPLTNLSLIGDRDTLSSISLEVQENMDLYYSSILTIEEMSSRMEAILADEQYDFNKPLKLRRTYSKKGW